MRLRCAHGGKTASAGLIAALFGVLAFALTWLLREVPLRPIARATDTGRTYAMALARTAPEEIARALGVLAGRESRRRVYVRLAARTGLALDPPSTAAPPLNTR